MADVPELHAPHRAHGGGVNWLELLLSVAAVITSIVSIYIAVQHGKVMDKLVAANSLPYLEVLTGNAGEDVSDARKPSFLALRNVGVGPARVVQLEVRGPDGRTIPTLQEMVRRCCAPDDAAALQQSYTIYNRAQRFIPARETDHVFVVRRTARNAAAWSRFDTYRDRLHVSGCYCSVFDECYRFDGTTGENTPVRTCVADPAHAFRPSF